MPREAADENHPVTVSDMISYLNEKRIQAVRQTVYADIDILTDAGFDIVVVKSTQNQYFMGNRLFEYPELKMLTDAVASSKIISRRKSEALIRKLCHLTSTYQASQLEKLASLSSRVKPDNEKVYYIIDTIYAAVLDHRQIRFQYYEYTQSKEKVLKHDGYCYLLDPYALEWKNDHYYLIGYSHKHQRMAHFRVDRLANIELLESRFFPSEEFDTAALHSDQGFQYTSQAYFKLTKQYGITPSMSRRGNPYDNAMAENFFSILKTECIYRHKPATFSEADEMIDRYIHFYNHERIQSKTGVPPLSLRHSC